MAKYILPDGKKIVVIPIKLQDPFSPMLTRDLHLAKSQGFNSIARESELEAYAAMVSSISSSNNS